MLNRLIKGGVKKLLVHASCSLQKMVRRRLISSSQIWGKMVGILSEAEKSVGMLECSTLFTEPCKPIGIVDR